MPKIEEAPNDLNLLTRYVEGSEIVYAANGPLVFVIDGVEYVIPLNYHCDGYSLPKVVRWMFARMFARKPLLIFAAVFHDWSNDIDSGFIGTRQDSDKIFRDLMGHYNMVWFWRKAFYASVKAFAGGVWKTQYMVVKEFDLPK